MAAPSSTTVLVARLLLLFFFFLGCVRAGAASANETAAFRPGEQLRRYKRVQALLRRLNKPALRTIQARACTPKFVFIVFERKPDSKCCRAPTATSSTAWRRTCSRRSTTPGCGDTAGHW
jgi:hypothetical protein